jgi:hypothetical protein
MSKTCAGPHHCIGTARSVTDIMFRTLRARCASNGGNLSLNELERFYPDFIGRMSAGFGMFELLHQRCMDASVSLAEKPFARGIILATLLHACGQRSALRAFSIQIEHCGAEWTHQFFEDFAHYIRTRMRTNVDLRLIDAYVDIATIPKIEMSVSELLKHESIQGVLRECFLPFEEPGALEVESGQLCDFVNELGAKTRGISEAHISKITDDQTRSFLSLLSREFRLVFNVPTPMPEQHAMPV